VSVHRFCEHNGADAQQGSISNAPQASLLHDPKTMRCREPISLLSAKGTKGHFPVESAVLSQIGVGSPVGRLQTAGVCALLSSDNFMGIQSERCTALVAKNSS